MTPGAIRLLLRLMWVGLKGAGRNSLMEPAIGGNVSAAVTETAQ